MITASLKDLATLKRHGLSVQPLDCGYGPVKGSWTLTDETGATLQIEGHGGVSPTKWEAVAEGLDRISRGFYYAMEDDLELT